MTYKILRQHWRGISSKDIGNGFQTPFTAEEIDETIANQRDKFEAAILRGIIKRARTGEIAAVVWLEERGFVKFPSKQGGRSESDSKS